MCRCCQRCFEDIYWNCIEERFCYDESIANYNPDEDDYIITEKNGIITNFQRTDNNNTSPVCTQPMRRTCSTISSKIHEEDYRREIQTNIPILAPEILSVFANSQIFADHQSKIPKNRTKTDLPSIHGNENNVDSNEKKLIKKLEGISDNENSSTEIISDKKIKFTISPESDSPVELRRSISPQRFAAIIEEDHNTDSINNLDNSISIDEVDKINKSITISEESSSNRNNNEKKPLRSVQSVPYFTFRPCSDNDIFSISGSLGRISMTPEVPSISYSNLPKNYIDTPTIEKYKESVSLYSLQTANKEKALRDDYSMPRYFRMPSIIMAHSTGNLSNSGGISGIKDGTTGTGTATSSLSSSTTTDHSKKSERGKRLRLLRGTLPPLLIHSVRHYTKKDDIKNVS